LLTTDRQDSNEENKNLTTRKVNLTQQQSTKMTGEHIHRQKKGLVVQEVTRTEIRISV